MSKDGEAMDKESKRISTAAIEAIQPTGGPVSAWPIVIEMSPSEIPITAPIELDKFLAGDTDACQVIAKIPEGWSYNGYYFSAGAIADIAGTIALNGITGGLGHVKDDMDFGEVAVVWVGALHKPELGATFVRGYINPERGEVKRLVRSGVINRVSTDGFAFFEDQEDNRKITTFNVVSLDLVPRFRNGTESGLAAKDIFHTPSPEADGKEVKGAEMEVEKEKTETTVAETETATPEAETPEVIADEPSADQVLKDLEAKASELEKTLADLKDMLAPLGDDPKKRISDLLELEANTLMSDATHVLTEAITDMVEGQDARLIVSMLLKPVKGEGIDEAKSRVQTCLANPELKRILTSRFADNAPKGSPAKRSGPILEWE